MEFFNQSVYHYVMGTKAPTSLPDQLTRWLIALLAEGKFYSIFSFLFGVGMALQWTRAEQGGTRFAGFWLRRMIVLLGFGLIHADRRWTYCASASLCHAPILRGSTYCSPFSFHPRCSSPRTM
jgi:uncharacterized protein